jgi:hypothetical protein
LWWPLLTREECLQQAMGEAVLGQYQARSDTAMGRHQVLVNCAFSFFWAAWFADHPPPTTRHCKNVIAIDLSSKRLAALLGP